MRCVTNVPPNGVPDTKSHETSNSTFIIYYRYNVPYQPTYDHKSQNMSCAYIMNHAYQAFPGQMRFHHSVGSALWCTTWPSMKNQYQTWSYPERAWTQNTNPPQILRVPGSNVTYFREKILWVLRELAVFRFCALRDTASTRSISRFCTTNTAILAVFRGSIMWNNAVLRVFGRSIPWNTVLLEVVRDPVLLVLWVLAVFRHLVLLILWTLGVFQDLILRGAVILEVFQGFTLRGTVGLSITRSILLECWGISGFNTLDTRGTPKYFI